MKKAGVWIDQKEANITFIVNETVQSKTIYSDVETRIRVEGEKKQYGRFGDQFLVDEKGKKNRIEEYTGRYLTRVLKALKNADQIMIYGPAQTKGRLEKLIIEDRELADKLIEVQTAENMTDNQKIAYVRKFYGVQ